MASLQDQYDDAMYEFSLGHFAEAVAALESILDVDPAHFEAQLALGMACSRLGDHARAIVEGHKAEKLRPQDQHVHTNLSLFYVKVGDKARAEHHGAQARVASWRSQLTPPTSAATGNAAPPPDSEPARGVPDQFPDMPWKKKSS